MDPSHFSVMGTGQEAEVYYDGPPAPFNPPPTASSLSPPLELVSPETALHSWSPPPNSTAFSPSYTVPTLPAPPISPRPDDGDGDDESDDADGADMKGRGARVRHTAKDLQILAEALYSINPYGAAHKEKGKRWNEVKDAVNERGAFLTSSVSTLRNKSTQLLKWHESPCATSCQAIEKTMTAAVAITIGAMLDYVCNLRDNAENAKEVKKEADRTQQLNAIGGQALRDASMQQFNYARRRGRQVKASPSASSIGSSSTTVTIAITPPTTPTRPGKRSRRALDSDDSVIIMDHGPSAPKKQRRSDIHELTTILRESEEQKQAQTTLVVGQMVAATEAYVKGTAAVVAALKDITRSE